MVDVDQDMKQDVNAIQLVVYINGVVKGNLGNMNHIKNMVDLKVNMEIQIVVEADALKAEKDTQAEKMQNKNVCNWYGIFCFTYYILYDE